MSPLFFFLWFFSSRSILFIMINIKFFFLKKKKNTSLFAFLFPRSTDTINTWQHPTCGARRLFSPFSTFLSFSCTNTHAFGCIPHPHPCALKESNFMMVDHGWKYHPTCLKLLNPPLMNCCDQCILLLVGESGWSEIGGAQLYNYSACLHFHSCKRHLAALFQWKVTIFS